jgi:hypothetical protein
MASLQSRCSTVQHSKAQHSKAHGTFSFVPHIMWSGQSTVAEALHVQKLRLILIAVPHDNAGC